MADELTDEDYDNIPPIRPTVVRKMIALTRERYDALLAAESRLSAAEGRANYWQMNCEEHIEVLGEKVATAQSSASTAREALRAMVQQSVDDENENMDPDECVEVDGFLNEDTVSWTPTVTGDVLKLVIAALAASLPTPQRKDTNG